MKSKKVLICYYDKHLKIVKKAYPQCSSPCTVSASIGIFTAGPEFCVHCFKVLSIVLPTVEKLGENISGQVDLKYPPSP